MEDIITGIPISDHDHGINGIEFGDNGELYIQVGGNTNAGIPVRHTQVFRNLNFYSLWARTGQINWEPPTKGELLISCHSGG